MFERCLELKLIYMSTEQLSISNINTTKATKTEIKRVDINTLMNKVREENKKESKQTLILFSVIFTVITIFGVMLSL